MSGSLRLDDQVCFALYKATNSMVRAYKPLLEPLGLTYPQYLVMLSLWQEDGVSVKELAQKTAMEPAQLTPLLKRLESKGILARRRQVEDERVMGITLTEFGQGLKSKAEQIPNQLACLVNLNADQLEALKGLSDAVSRHLTNDG